MRVLIADDHAVVRAGYKQFLEAAPRITEVGEACSGADTLDQLRRQDWDLLLMDIQMPDRNGIDILRHVISSHIHLKVLIMSGLPEQQYARNVIRAGAKGFLSKGGSPSDLLEAVQTVLEGRRYVSSSLAQSMAVDLQTQGCVERPIHTTLTAREFQIFCKLAWGSPVNAIAKELFLSAKTVSAYRTRILEKMNFSNNTQITAYALRNGLTQ
jgi:two-component system invasion response regulator UvrY